MKRTFFIWVWLLAIPTPADACQCTASESLTKAFEKAETVFLGKVVSVEESAPDDLYPHFSRQVNFTVTRQWKGKARDQLTVFTGAGGGDCGYHFGQEQSYLVYASAQKGHLTTSICSRTRPATNQTKELEELNKLAPPKADLLKQ